MSQLSTLVVALLALTTPAYAQAPAATPAPQAPPAAPAPEMPKPAPELQKLAFLVGDWLHSENYNPGPMGPGGKGGGRSKTQWTLGEHHLYVIYASKTPMGTIEGRGFLGWDAEKKAYRLSWFDNTGAAVDYSGDFNAEGVLALNAEYVQQGKPVKEQFSIKRQEDGKILFTSAVAGTDGAMAVAMESLASPEAKK